MRVTRGSLCCVHSSRGGSGGITERAGLLIAGVVHGGTCRCRRPGHREMTAALLEDRGAGAGEADEDPNDEHNGGEDDHGGGGADDVYGSLGEAAETGGGGFAVVEDGHAVEFGDGHALWNVAGRDIGDDADIHGELLEAASTPGSSAAWRAGKRDVDGVGASSRP